MSKLPSIGEILKSTGRTVLSSLQGLADAGSAPIKAINRAVAGQDFYTPNRYNPQNPNLQANIKGGSLAPATAVGIGTGSLPSYALQAGAGGLLNGVVNKVQGGSFLQGFGQGAESAYKAAPFVQSIVGVTNPILNAGVQKIAGSMPSPLANQLATRTAAGAANVIQGAPISAGMGQNPLSNAPLDFGIGFVGGKNSFSNTSNLTKSQSKKLDQEFLQIKKDIRNMSPEELKASTVMNPMPENLKGWRQSVSNLNDLITGKKTTEDLGMNLVSLKSAKEIIQEKGTKIAENKPFENPTDPYFNVKRLGVDNKTKEAVKKVVEEVKPQIEKVVGKTLSNEEAITLANKTSKTLDSAVGRQQTLEWEAAMLKTRQKLAELSKTGTVDKEYLDTLVAVKSLGTDIARKLQSFSIDAVPSEVKVRNQILQAVLDATNNTDEVLKAAENVDFNNGKQAADFYRTFIKPTKSEFNDLLRYNSMLSSPNTHINNAFSNVLNTAIVAPIEKTVTGTLDFLGSLKTGKRNAFAGEGAAYAKGYWSNVRNAADNFINHINDKTLSQNLDMGNMPLTKSTSRLRKYENVLRTPTKLLEGVDQFFTTLTKGGEEAALNYRQSKGVDVSNIAGKAEESAAYRLFRSELQREGQGTLLNAVDEVTGKVQALRSSKNPVVSNIAKFTLPFVRTPMNMLKQGIEYSPAGLLTLKGAGNKTEQLSKALIGTSAAVSTYLLASSGRTTWAEPTDQTKKNAFRSAGMQPYSVKIGDSWVSFAKLPPAMSFPMALTAALHDAQANARLDDTQLDNILSAVAKWGNFFADQSYLKNIGDMLAATKGDVEGVARFVSNYPMQEIPFRGLLSWAARITDPYQRKVDTDQSQLKQLIQQAAMNIPTLSQTVPARVDKFGMPVANNNRVFNAVSPVKVTNEDTTNKSYYDLLLEQSKMRKDTNDLKKSLLKGDNGTNKALAAGPEDTPTSIKDIKAKEERYKMLNNVWDKVYLSGGSKNDVVNMLKKSGLDPVESEYNYLSGESQQVKSAFIAEKVQSSANPLRTLIELRKEGVVSNQPILTNSLVDEFERQGYIDSKTAKFLKKTYYDPKAKTVKIKVSKGTGKKKSSGVSLKLNLPKLTTVETTQRKVRDIPQSLTKIKTPKLL